MAKPKIIDPTKNVLRYVKDAVRNINKKIKATEAHAQQLREAESKRIDANRAGDLKALEVQAGQTQTKDKDFSDRLLELERGYSQNQGNKTGIKEMVGYIFAILTLLIMGLALYLKK